MAEEQFSTWSGLCKDLQPRRHKNFLRNSQMTSGCSASRIQNSYWRAFSLLLLPICDSTSIMCCYLEAHFGELFLSLFAFQFCFLGVSMTNFWLLCTSNKSRWLTHSAMKSTLMCSIHSYAGVMTVVLSTDVDAGYSGE